jgi:hypothetical protein
MKRHSLSFVLLAMLALVPSAHAQEASADAAPTSAQPPAAAAPPRTVAPIMVVVLGGPRVGVDVVDATREALVAQLTPMTGGRPVLPLMADAMRDQLGACADAPCAGAIIANAGAFGAVIARLSRASARRPLTLTLDMIDPVSGSPRLPQQSATLTDAASAAAALAPLTTALAPSMFSPPPPPPTLLVTVNVDGASVRIDDQDLGLSPVARTTLTPGHHVITVTHAGHLSARRTIDLTDAQTERLDITLVDASAAMGDDAIAMPVGEGTSTAGGVTAPSRQWFEEPLVWVAIGGGVVLIGAAIGIGVGISSANNVTPPPMGIPLPPINNP